MEKKTFKAIGTSITSPIDNRKRKEVFVKKIKMFSQQIDLSDLIGMDPASQHAIVAFPYEVLSKTGQVLLKGKTDDIGDTDRVFTRDLEDLILYVGDGEWSLGLDCKHEQ
jgi:hypothetical protein